MSAKFENENRLNNPEIANEIFVRAKRIQDSLTEPRERSLAAAAVFVSMLPGSEPTVRDGIGTMRDIKGALEIGSQNLTDQEIASLDKAAIRLAADLAAKADQSNALAKGLISQPSLLPIASFTSGEDACADVARARRVSEKYPPSKKELRRRALLDTERALDADRQVAARTKLRVANARSRFPVPHATND